MPAYKYQMKNGKTKWYANFYYTDWLGRKQHKCKRGFDTRREAQEWERNFLESTSKDPTITFSALCEKYFAEIEERTKPTTQDNKGSIFERKLIPFFGELRICDITPATVMRWQNELLSYRDEKGKPYSQTYLRSIHSQLSAVMNYAVKFYGLRVNPCKAAGAIGKDNADEMKIWTKDQFNQFMEHEHMRLYRLIYSTLFYSGIREAELLALTPADVYDELLDINKNYAKVKGKEYFLTPKTQRSIRKVTIPESLYKELREYIQDCSIEDDERIFDRSKYALLGEFHRVAKRAGLPPIRIHDLRHSHVAMLIDMRFPIEEIADRLGHESASITWKTYAHLYPGTDKALAKRLNEVRMPHAPGSVTSPKLPDSGASAEKL